MKNNILFFLSHQPNPRFIKQINFLANENNIFLVYFERENSVPTLLQSLNNSVVVYNIGYIKNFKVKPNFKDYFERLAIYKKALSFIRKLNKLNNFKIILINNIDMLFIYVISTLGLDNTKKIFTIEISDLQEYVFYKSLASKLVRQFERFLFKLYIDKLIVTSKKYYDFHYSKFFKKDLFVLENKILSTEICIPNKKFKRTNTDNKLIIGIVGLLIRKEEYIKLFETYKNSTDVDIHIYGTGPFQYIVENYAEKYSNISYFGKYNLFLDSYKIYNSIDILYVVYDNDLVSKNNKLALPNKLYEAMYFKVPLICSSETYLEEIVTDLGIGIGINYKLKGEIECAVKKLKEDKSKIITNFKKLPNDNFIADNDYIKFSNFLKRKSK